ncbi:pyridine nucleotide-disulfide oxidoreductase [Teladorsagia circumcincta]|uniref:Pyridine nucleotide-disulfide oxidoreductase n=1 Tax=Teladorsagia circumcincta TaxID=45464 RepID=A0A2G9UY89_TELCI|nr:pyridine nucleotide-disulfide oxidoreductase [Teladorsagia circumcincta]
MSSAAEAGYDSSPAVTQTIGKAAEVPPGTKKIFIVKDKPILVINDNGTLYATSGLCSFRDSLENGKLDFNDRDVKDNDGDLVINTTEMQLANLRRVRRSHVTELDKTAPIVVVGAGMSAATFVEQARLTGCTTPITMITQEDFLPYDRAQLSKIPATPGKEIELRDGDYYKENQINILTNAHVNYIDVNRHSLALSTGKRLRFSKLVLALGAEPKKLDIPGADLKLHERCPALTSKKHS